MISNTELKKFVDKNLYYISEERRFETFKNWKFGSRDQCNSTKMAEAGFIFIGDKSAPDAVKCFLCDKALDGWSATDKPWDEHSKHSAHCSFVKLRKPYNALTLGDYINIQQELEQNAVKKYYEQIEEIVKIKINKLKKDVEKKLKQ